MSKYSSDIIIITKCEDDVIRLEYKNFEAADGRNANIIKIWDAEAGEYIVFTGFDRFHIYKLNSTQIKARFMFSRSGINWEESHYININK